jgi:hypothetical protein
MDYVKVNRFTYFSVKIENNDTKGVTNVSKNFKLCNRVWKCSHPLSWGMPVLTFTAVEISVHSQPFHSQVMYIWYINVCTSHLRFLHFSYALL